MVDNKIVMKRGFLIVLILAACTPTVKTFSTTEIVNGAPIGRKYSFITHVRAEKNICFDYSDKADMSDVLDEVKKKYGADALVNVKYTAKTTGGGAWANFFTLGIANCKDTIIEGDAIKWEDEVKK